VHRHTRLVNNVLGLCVPDAMGKPALLLDHGYRAHAIERSVRAGDRIVVPDVVFINEEKGHMVVIDCKSGANVRKDQDERYSSMRLEDLIKSTMPACKVSSHTFAYAIEEPNFVRIRPHTDAALMVFGQNSVRGSGDFANAELTRSLLKGAPLENAPCPRLVAYPFSIHDKRSDIDGRVEIGLSLYMGAHAMEGKPPANNAVALGVLRIVHPYHAIFAPSHRAELVGAIRESIARILAEPRQ